MADHALTTESESSFLTGVERFTGRCACGSEFAWYASAEGLRRAFAAHARLSDAPTEDA